VTARGSLVTQGLEERYGRRMDDADGGFRGLRARPEPGLLRALREQWGLGRLARVVDLGGSSSLNLLVGDSDRRWVVRVHRPHVTPSGWAPSTRPGASC
jgi:hypothetical protein